MKTKKQWSEKLVEIVVWDAHIENIDYKTLIFIYYTILFESKITPFGRFAVISVDPSEVWISCSLSVISDDVIGVGLLFNDVDCSGDVEIIFCEVDEPPWDSVVLLFCSVGEFSGEVVEALGDVDVILNMAPSNWHCSISSGSYCNTHCMPSDNSVKKKLQLGKTIQKK